MSEKKIVLSKRLQMLANLVTPGNRLVDVGCDHGFLSIFLVQSGQCPGALAMDVRKGPLSAAGEHVAECGLENYIETRLSDGLMSFQEGEAQSCVCAGMGGRLMARILSDSMDKVRSLGELILQPQSELREFRSFLRENGIEIIREDAVQEEGKFYFCMKAVYTGRRHAVDGISDEYGGLLLEQKHPVLLEFLQFRRKLLMELEETLGAGDSKRTEERLLRVRYELSEIDAAMARFEN